MLRIMKRMGWIVAVAAMVLSPSVFAQDEDQGNSDQNDSESFQNRISRNDQTESPMRIDRYLDVQVWPNRDDAEYYAGDNIVLNYRANRDCFVAIYSIDSRGRVNLLFPADPSDDNFVTGGVTYRLPGGNDKYDLVVNGPSGREQIQIVASRERIQIPNWYKNSGIVCDDTDRDGFMDNLNDKYFVRYPGQRFALDRAVIFVNEWEQDYYRPVYSPYYPDWAVCGNVYIDYPWGGAVYINGIYWGCAPMYIPRLVCGWHVITIYDSYGACWESDFHVSRYHSLVFDRNVVKTTRVVDSRYADVRVSRWKDPIRNGYPTFKAEPNVTKTPRGTVIGRQPGMDKTTLGSASIDTFTPLNKRYLRGDTKLVKTTRGFETEGDANGVRTTDNMNAGRTNRLGEGVGTQSKTRSGAYESPIVRSREAGNAGGSKQSTSGSAGQSRPAYRQPAGGEYKRERPAKVEPQPQQPQPKSGGNESKPAAQGKGKAPASAPAPSGPAPAGKQGGGGEHKGKRP